MNNYCTLIIALIFDFFTGEKVFPLAWEVIETLELYNIPVVSLTSDGAKSNRCFYRLCNGKLKEVPYKTFNPFRDGEDIFFFCDAPHLLKTAHNCFSNSFAHSRSRAMQVYISIVCCFLAVTLISFCRNAVNQSVGNG